jgi:hypothetical protein
MNFDLTGQSVMEVQFHMIIDGLSQIYALQDFILKHHAESTGSDFAQLKAELEKSASRYRQIIHDKIDEDYGHLNAEALKK